MDGKIRKIKQYLKLIFPRRWADKREIEEIYYAPCGYKNDHTPPSIEAMSLFGREQFWGLENDSHGWFRFKVTAESENTFLRVETDRNGWDANNPQFIVYIDGVLVQGLDVNHREVALCAGKTLDVAIYAYTGQDINTVRFFAYTVRLVPDLFELYYDLRYPLDMLDYLGRESTEYARIVDYLWRAVSMLDLYDINSDEFISSAARAHQFLADEFYGKYCGKQNATTVGIGHTHIDCAWLWTLRQTREKVSAPFLPYLSLCAVTPSTNLCHPRRFSIRTSRRMRQSYSAR